MLAASNITKYHAAQLVLHDVTVVVPPRSWIGLVGRNGVGKSTLFHAIRGDLPVESGSIALPPRWRIGSLAQQDCCFGDRLARRGSRNR